MHIRTRARRMATRHFTSLPTHIHENDFRERLFALDFDEAFYALFACPYYCPTGNGWRWELFLNSVSAPREHTPLYFILPFPFTLNLHINLSYMYVPSLLAPPFHFFVLIFVFSISFHVLLSLFMLQRSKLLTLFFFSFSLLFSTCTHTHKHTHTHTHTHTHIYIYI